MTPRSSVRRSPKVSVLLPIRDAESTLPAALESIRAQTLSDWEVIAVDDGSRDDSASLVEALARTDPRFRLLLRPREGIVPALEAARAEARSPILARMDADDVAEPERLELQSGLLESARGVAVCGTHVRYFPRAGVRAGALRYERWLNSLRGPADLDRDLWIECPLAHPTFAMRARRVEEVGGYRDPGWAEDYDLLLRLRSAGGRLAVVPRVLLHWREGAGRLSRTDRRYAPESFRRAKLHFLRRSLLGRKDGLLIWGAGPLGKAIAREASALGIPVRAFVELDPRKIGQKIHGAPVIAPSGIKVYRGSLALAAVGRPGGRAMIRDALREAGWREGKDFVAVA